jgi:hypothetical protein
MITSPIKHSIINGDLYSVEEYIRFFLVFIRVLGLRKKSKNGSINPFIRKFYMRFGEVYLPIADRV